MPSTSAFRALVLPALAGSLGFAPGPCMPAAHGLAPAWLPTYPKPAAIPYRWELEFKPGDLRLYRSPADGSHWWYFSYTVTNRTGRDQVWAPRLVLFTDTGNILRSGEDVPPRIAADIHEVLGNELMEFQNEVIGDIFQGAEHAKEGLVVWRADESIRANEMSLFVSGISGETARVVNPITGEETILRKTLHRRYLVRGDATALGPRPVEILGDSWVMR